MKNKTIFHRVNKTENYTVISNDLIKSKKLSSDEKVILFHILSLPNDWCLYKSNLEKEYSTNMKKGKFEKAWKGLVDKGYLSRIRVKDKNGKFNSWEYEVHEVPITDTLKTEESVIGVVENTTSHNSGYILNTNVISTNKQSTNLESNNVSSTSIILGETKSIKNPEKKKHWTDTEIQRDINFKAFNSIFEKYGINWELEINSITPEMFIKKYVKLYSEDIDESRLKNLVENYIKLNPSKINNSQPPRRG